MEASPHPEWAPCSWRIAGAPRRDGVHIDVAPQLKGPDLFAVRRDGSVLDHDGEWEWEPQPSSRDDQFLARCRFATLADAQAAYLKSLSHR